MERQFEKELNELRKNLLKMGTLVEKAIHNAVKSLVERDSDLAQMIINCDTQIDKLEMDLEESAIKLLALRQPMARDLRFITKSIKIISSLERIGDHAVNICEKALQLNKEPQLKEYIDIPRMAEAAQMMLKNALDAFINEDTTLAFKVCQDDQIIDDLNDQILRELLTYMLEDPRTITRAILIIQISKYLERIGDLATNIAESVIYMVEARDIRHRSHLDKK
ncbi:MAG: phosphate signaling complex protein PhoU [Thermodesulfobacteriota bacterium]|nr:phosphate signaling complex protein PhoU [Thermodesulfobacteriota bacterium]